MKVNELVGPLFTFEMTITNKSEKTSKGVTFKVNTEDCDDQIEFDDADNMTDLFSC